MSGHSKWSTIKRQKASNDAKRGQLFTKVTRAITITARKGGGDPERNAALRQALEKAKSVNLPKENIKRAIERGTGGVEGGKNFDEVVYEGYGPHGVAFLVEAVTDNKNRTLSEVRSVLERNGGSLGEPGSAAYIFENREEPLFEIELDDTQEDQVIKLMSQLDDLDDVQEVYSNLK